MTLLADGFEDALIGVGTQYDQSVAVYDYEKCVKVLMTNMSEEEAREYMDFNVCDAYVGAGMPVFIRERKNGDS